jgi:alpha-galactosidase
MADAITELAKKYHEPPFWYSLCNWGWTQVQIWGPKIARE